MFLNWSRLSRAMKKLCGALVLFTYFLSFLKLIITFPYQSQNVVYIKFQIENINLIFESLNSTLLIVCTITLLWELWCVLPERGSKMKRKTIYCLVFLWWYKINLKCISYWTIHVYKEYSALLFITAVHNDLLLRWSTENKWGQMASQIEALCRHSRNGET